MPACKRVPVLILLVAMACNGPGSASAQPDTQVRDSAGIRILESASPSPGSRLDWRSGPAPSAGRR